jgi:hypothetical protein
MKVLLSELPVRPYRPRHRRPVPWMPPKKPAQLLIVRYSSQIPRQAAAWLHAIQPVGKQ